MTNRSSSAIAAHPNTPALNFIARVRMRDATHADIDTLVPMINAAYKARDGWLFGDKMRLTADDLLEEFTDERATGIVATVDGAIAGFAVVRRRDAHADFGLLAVDRAWQGNGLARMLVRRAEALARDAGCREMRLECIRENNLPPFYEALGYRVEHEERASRWNSLQPFTLVTMARALKPVRAATPDPALAATVSFRNARPEDVSVVAAIVNHAYLLSEAWLLPPPRTTEAALHAEFDEGTSVIVAELDGEISGSIAVWLQAPEPHFGMLAVAPEYQGRGLASLLVAAAERAARDAGFASIALETAKELGLPALYASLGYAIVSEEVGLYLGAERPITKVTMRKEMEDEGTSRVRPDGQDGDHHGR